MSGLRRGFEALARGPGCTSVALYERLSGAFSDATERGWAWRGVSVAVVLALCCARGPWWRSRGRTLAV